MCRYTPGVLLWLLACDATLGRPGDAVDTDPIDGPTWYADVSPMLQQNCTRCHQPGGVGASDLTDYASAAGVAEVALALVAIGEMPPPASDPDCRDYVGSETMSVDPALEQTLAEWIDAGKPLGNPADAVDVEAAEYELQDPDFTVQPVSAFTPAFRADGNAWHCAVLPGVPDEDYYLTGMQAVIDHEPMVHHIVLYTVNGASLTPTYTQAEGFDCAGGEQAAVTRDAIGVWAPGMLPIELPDGVGIPMVGGEPLLLEYHYYDNGDLDGVTDRSGYAFHTTDAVETDVTPYTWGTADFLIPAGAEDHSAHWTAEFPATPEYRLYTMWPHMHVLGDSYEVTVSNPDGTEDCLVRSDGYSFENQYAYRFTEPFVAEPGGVVNTRCTWDNSADNPNQLNDEPVDTTYGAGSADEMCWFYGLFSTHGLSPKVSVGQVLAGEVTLLEGVEDLDLDGDIRGWNHGGAQVEVGGQTFEAGIATPTYAANVPELDGDLATWSGLEQVAYTTTYALADEEITQTLPASAGPHRLQLVFFETYWTEQGNRLVDIEVDGQVVVQALDPHTRSNAAAVLYSLDVNATGDLTVTVRGAAGSDGTSVLNATTLESL